MTTEEFSNGFDTLVSAYLHDALFGELSSIADVTLDEYEKSIFLTLALDLIVKSYFEAQLNSNGAGFDDSTRRLMDYANLITTRTFTALKSDQSEAFSERGVIIDFNTSYTEDNVFKTTIDEDTKLEYYMSPLFIINERVMAGGTYKAGTEAVAATEAGIAEIPNSYTGCTGHSFLKIKNISTLPINLIVNISTTNTDTALAKNNPITVSVETNSINITILLCASNMGKLTSYQLVNEILITGLLTDYVEVSTDYPLEKYLLGDEYMGTINKALEGQSATRESYVGGKNYVIVPLNYKDYDRMMSRAYCEPLKRLAWRLFETDLHELSVSAEIILRSDAGSFNKYVVRYVRRPRPIILVDLTNTDNGLTIDNVQKKTECELNPVIHNEILLLAVLLALTSRGIETRDMKAAREQASKN